MAQTRSNELKDIIVVAAENFLPYFIHNDSVYIHTGRKTVLIHTINDLKRYI
jgi:hypothetical protein